MGLKRGYAAVRKAKENADRSRKRMDAMRTRDLFLRDGEEAVIWFNGTSDEPVVAVHHGVNIGDGKKRRFSMELCAHGFDDHDGCVYCYANKRKNKAVGRQQDQYLWNVFDTRWVHKRKNIEVSKDKGRDVYDWEDCLAEDQNSEEPDKSACEFCRKLSKWPRERRGQKKLRIGLQQANQLMELDKSLAKKCMSCGGKTTLTGYKNGKKVLPDIDDVDNPEDWTPQYDCSKCNKPVAGSIRMAPILYKRTGSNKATTYTFSPVNGSKNPFEDPPEFVTEAEVIDFDEALIPRPADNMADQLDIENPFDEFAKKKNRKRDDEADDYDDDDDDDEEEEKSSKKRGRKQEDDDEEDDPFDDEEEDEDEEDEEEEDD